MSLSSDYRPSPIEDSGYIHRAPDRRKILGIIDINPQRRRRQLNVDSLIDYGQDFIESIRDSRGTVTLDQIVEEGISDNPEILSDPIKLIELLMARFDGLSVIIPRI